MRLYQDRDHRVSVSSPSAYIVGGMASAKREKFVNREDGTVRKPFLLNSN